MLLYQLRNFKFGISGGSIIEHEIKNDLQNELFILFQFTVSPQASMLNGLVPFRVDYHSCRNAEIPRNFYFNNIIIGQS
jgi:hypothetical protein